MPKFFSTPADAPKQERIAYPEKPFTQDQLLDDEALRCLLYPAHRTGIPVRDLLSYIVKDWYDIESDAPAPHIRAMIAYQKKEAA